MNCTLLRKRIYKKSKENAQKKSRMLKLHQLRLNYKEQKRSSFFKLWVENINLFINLGQLWKYDDTKPKFRDYICIKKQNGYLIMLHTLQTQKQCTFSNFFGHGNVEIPQDMKGQRSLDNFESTLDRNKNIYYRPNVKGLDTMRISISNSWKLLLTHRKKSKILFRLIKIWKISKRTRHLL